MKEFTDTDIDHIEQLIDRERQYEAGLEVSELPIVDIAELLQSLNLKQAEWLFSLIIRDCLIIRCKNL
ncbi:MAG: hypothetical protein HDR88_02585 [Bacteroides sp.]|nr:hypothetical protein [Bacteroides sp.]